MKEGMKSLTLFEFCDALGSLKAVAVRLRVDKSTISRINSGEIRVSNAVHDRCVELWGAAYDHLGTHAESRRRWAARERAPQAVCGVGP